MTTSEIAPYEGGQPDLYRPQIMTPEAAKALDDSVRRCTNAVLREGTDYGIIPGTSGEKTLWRPGAQKLLQWFQLECICERTEVERDDEGRKHGITYRAEVGKGLKTATPIILATCEGTADYDESKFYQTAEQVKVRLRELEHKWAAKDRRPPNADRWNSATEYRADWNALMKRAQKRAIVGAVSDATAAGGIFSDREEDDSPVSQEEGSTWYEQALEQAVTFTEVKAGNELYVEAGRACRDGLATVRQKDHIQNRVKLRLKQLESHAQADVTTYADDVAAAQDASPAPGNHRPAGSASPHAEPASPVVGAAGEAPKPVITAIRDEFTRLGIEDSSDRAIYVAKILRLDDVPGSLNKLTSGQKEQLHAALQLATDIDALEALINDGVIAQDAAEGEADGGQ